MGILHKNKLHLKMLRGWLLIVVRANQFNEVSVFLIAENFGAKRALMGKNHAWLGCGNVIIRVS